MQSEKNIESGFVRKIKPLKWMSYKMVAGMISAGWPDRLVVLPGGICVFIEFKTLKGKNTPLQQHRQDQLIALGHRVHVCRSAADAIETCQSYL